MASVDETVAVAMPVENKNQASSGLLTATALCESLRNLEAMGFVRHKRNLALLWKAQGDVTAVAEQLTEKQQKRQKKDSSHSKNQDNGQADQEEKEESEKSDFEKHRKGRGKWGKSHQQARDKEENSNSNSTGNGNGLKVMVDDWLQHRQAKAASRVAFTNNRDDDFKHLVSQVKQSPDFAAVAAAAAAAAAATERAVTDKRILQMLRRCQGDVAVVLQKLQRLSARLIKKQQKKQELDQATVKYAVELEKLKKLGVAVSLKPQLFVRLLVKFDGDVSRVVKRLEKCRRHQCVQQPNTNNNNNNNNNNKNVDDAAAIIVPSSANQDAVMPQASAQQVKEQTNKKPQDKEEADNKDEDEDEDEVAAALSSKLKQLSDLGFDKSGRNRGLLRRFHGDVSQVAEFLTGKQAAKQQKQQQQQQGKDRHRRHAHDEDKQQDKQPHQRGQRRGAKSASPSSDKVKEEVPFVRLGDVDEVNNDNTLESLMQHWPKQIKQLYLDGNNMLYVDDKIRKLVLNRSTVGQAEAALAGACRRVVSHLSTHNALKKAVLLFDNARKVNINHNDPVMPVMTARPTYATSDDLLVHWAEQIQTQAQAKVQPQPQSQPQPQPQNGKGDDTDVVSTGDCLFVTSDRGLIARLHALGARVMKPKMFFRLIKALDLASPQPATTATTTTTVTKSVERKCDDAGHDEDKDQDEDEDKDQDQEKEEDQDKDKDKDQEKEEGEGEDKDEVEDDDDDDDEEEDVEDLLADLSVDEVQKLFGNLSTPSNQSDHPNPSINKKP